MKKPRLLPPSLYSLAGALAVVALAPLATFAVADATTFGTTPATTSTDPKHPLAIELAKTNRERDAYFANLLARRNTADKAAVASLKTRAVNANASIEDLQTLDAARAAIIANAPIPPAALANKLIAKDYDTLRKSRAAALLTANRNVASISKTTYGSIYKRAIAAGKYDIAKAAKAEIDGADEKAKGIAAEAIITGTYKMRIHGEVWVFGENNIAKFYLRNAKTPHLTKKIKSFREGGEIKVKTFDIKDGKEGFSFVVSKDGKRITLSDGGVLDKQ
jgi:hypothetical protein